MRPLRLVRVESGEAALLRDPLGLVAENHGIAVERDAQLVVHLRGRLRRQDRRRGDAVLQGVAYRLGIRRQEQLGAKRA